ncbi:antitoxin Xre/MbcA/ParS toxin-binding domain-containing protein [Marinobacterium aestuariivivens]|uniref:Antitoxin Xre/MbcA/ParS toxin-binding domain-containing protein n=1 Tax=Marinobacterium aestuariivivens TaxID=1698799 RepID=A0ABW2A9K3_9GAMM
MSLAAAHRPDPAVVLGTAVLNTRPLLGLTHEELGRILGRDRTTIQRTGIDPLSPAGQLAVLLIRVYRSAHVLMGSDDGVKHWLGTGNRTFGRPPRELLFSLQGLVHVVEYLDAYRGKV